MPTAQEAFVVASSAQRAMNSSRYIPDMADIVREASEAHRLYIFNVGPWSHMRQMGSAGRYFVPACPEGKEYSEPLVVQGIENEPYPISPTEMAILPKTGRPGQIRGDGDGILFAQQILGEGPMVPPNTSWRPFGVFISKTLKPSKEDLAAARAALQQRYVALIGEANDAWARGRAEAKDIIQKKWHHTAAHALSKTPVECPWMGDTELPAERLKCESCGTPYEVGIAECPKCGNVLDMAKYKAKLDRLEEARSGSRKK